MDTVIVLSLQSEGCRRMIHDRIVSILYHNGIRREIRAFDDTMWIRSDYANEHDSIVSVLTDEDL